MDNNLLDEKEKYWIKYYDSYNHGYNSTIGGREIALYDFNEEQIIQDYYELKTARKVAQKYGVDHNTIDRILSKHNISRFSQRQYNGQHVKAVKNNKEYLFDSIADCADFIIKQNGIKTNSVRTARQNISDYINGRKTTSYYGWSFYKE